MRTEWFSTDSDSCQYQRKIGDREYEMIQMVWLDTCRGDEGYPDKEYTVMTGYIPLKDYTEEEILCHISSYGYESIQDVIDNYGQNGSDGIIAECIFEDMVDGECTTYGMMTREEAEKFVKEYISKR